MEQPLDSRAQSMAAAIRRQGELVLVAVLAEAVGESARGLDREGNRKGRRLASRPVGSVDDGDMGGRPGLMAFGKMERMAAESLTV